MCCLAPPVQTCICIRVVAILLPIAALSLQHGCCWQDDRQHDAWCPSEQKDEELMPSSFQVSISPYMLMCIVFQPSSVTFRQFQSSTLIMICNLKQAVLKLPSLSENVLWPAFLCCSESQVIIAGFEMGTAILPQWGILYIGADGGGTGTT